MKQILLVKLSSDETELNVKECGEKLRNALGELFHVVVIKSVHVKEPVFDILYNPNNLNEPKTKCSGNFLADSIT